MADRRSWEYRTVQIKGDLAQLGAECIDGWRFREFVSIDIVTDIEGRCSRATFVVLLEREVSSIIT